MKYIVSFLILLICFHAENCNSQIQHDVIANGGKTNYPDSLLIEWTLGEVFVQTWDSYVLLPSTIVTEGFHQPLPPIVSLIEEQRLDKTAYIYPIPTHQFLTVANTSTIASILHLLIYDMNGNLVLDEWSDNISDQYLMDLTPLSTGEYFLQIYSRDLDYLSTHKIVKL